MEHQVTEEPSADLCTSRAASQVEWNERGGELADAMEHQGTEEPSADLCTSGAASQAERMETEYGED